MYTLQCTIGVNWEYQQKKTFKHSKLLRNEVKYDVKTAVMGYWTMFINAVVQATNYTIRFMNLVMLILKRKNRRSTYFNRLFSRVEYIHSTQTVTSTELD